MTGNYEVMMVFSLKNGEEAAVALKDKFQAMIEANGTIDTVDKWGTKKFAYDINYKSEGYYVLINFKANSDLPNELERIMKITDGVVRFIVLKK